MAPAFASSLPFFFSSIKYLLGMDERRESANASENLDQDAEQMRSEGKGRRSGVGEMAACLRASVCVCVAWHGVYERCQTSLCSSTGGVN